MPEPDSDFPVNESAEKSVLGSCIECPDLLTAALAEGLSAEDFSVSAYRRLFGALLQMQDKDIPIDCISISEYLGNHPDDFALVVDLICGAMVHPSHVAHHARIVRRKSRLRSCLRFSDRIAQAAVEPGADPDQIVKLVGETGAAL
jgi:replicative DNA helicase